MSWEIDRTSVLSAQKCPRDRFYSRHFNGTGIERIRKSLPLAFGSAFHAGAESLLAGDIEGAVAKAKLYLDLAFSNDAIDLEEKQTEYAIGEQKAIAEGLLRGWWAYDGQRFLRDFEVISVEEEGRANLSDDMVLLFRPDAVVRERATGDYYVISWKTASTFGQYTTNSIQTDMQSMSEVFGVEQVANGADLSTSKIHIEGVNYLFAVKGQRRMNDYLGFKVQDTPLAYGWKREGPTPEETEYAWKYKWQTEEINQKTGKPVGTTLGKGFKSFAVWSDYPGGVKAWIDDLSNQRIEPRHINALEGVFPQSMPVSRRADEIESWKRQTVAAESRIRDSVNYVLPNPTDEMLDIEFPQSTARCFDYQSKCSFFDICWNPAVKQDPLASGLYQIRIPNHPTEKGGDE